MTALSIELVEGTKQKNISPLAGQAVDVFWGNTIWPCLREIPGHTILYDEAYSFQMVKMGHWQVWAYSDSEIRGIVVTRINIFPKCKVLDILGMYGVSGLEFMDNLNDVFEVLAAQQDCAYMSCGTRPGMERILGKKFGAERIYSVLFRPVGQVRRS